MASTRTETLARERRWARPAGIAALLIPVLYVASTYIRSSVGSAATLATEQFGSIARDEAELLGSAALAGLGLGLASLPLAYLFLAARARSDRVSSTMYGFAFVGPILLAVQQILAGFAQAQLASDFAAQAETGGDIYSLLDDLLSDSSLFTVAQLISVPAFLGFVVAMVYIPLQALRVGLLTQFFATIGMAFGAGLILFQVIGIPGGIALVALMLWFGWLGLLILGRTPRGRPPAWAAGEAIPWPRPGEEPAKRATSAPSDAAVEGDANEVLPAPGTATKDHAARRERARKRKRKRRR